MDGRKKRSEATQLRRSVFGKKHDLLGENKVCIFIQSSYIFTHYSEPIILRVIPRSYHRKLPEIIF